MVGAHWPSLVSQATRDAAPGATDPRLERALAVAGAVAWQWDIVTRQSDFATGDAALLHLKDAPFAETFALVHPADRDWLRDAIIQAVAGRISYDFEFRLQRPDGAVEWVHDRAGVERDAIGTPLRLIGMARIITAKKRTEAAFAATFEQAAVGMAHCTPDGAFIRVNTRFCQIMGRSRDELLALRFQDITHPDDLAGSLASVRDLLGGRIPRQVIEKRYIRPDKTIIWARLSTSLVCDASDRPDYLLAVVDDITELKDSSRMLSKLQSALDGLAESEARLRLSQEGGRIGSWDWDLASNTVVWSDFQCRQFGVDPALKNAVPFDTWKNMVHPDDLAQAERRFDAALAGDGVVENEYRVCMPDGSTRWFNGRGHITRDEAGRPVRMTGIDIDITERRALQEELRQARDALAARVRREQELVAERTAELRRANARLRTEIERREQAQSALLHSQKMEALGQLTAGISHDFNNIIAAISGAFGLIQRRSQDPRILDIAAHGHRAAWRGDALVKQLLMFARQQTLTPKAVDLRAMLDEAEPLLRRSVGSALTLAVNCPADVVTVRVDPVQLESALINLAVNARDAMPDGGSLSITVRPCPPDMPDRPPELAGADAVVIDIEDTGIGIPPDILQRVIEPFFTTKGAGKGSGLGLAMVHGFAQASGGALRIVSREGQGTTVSLYLPQAANEVAQMQSVRTETQAIDPNLHGGATILLVDDDDMVRAILSAQLSDFNYTVIEAASGAVALQAIDEAPVIDLVLTDVTMPVMDGPELAAAIHEKRPALPILFMTGHSDLERLSGKPVIEKPFGAEVLLSRVLAMLNRRPAEADLDDQALDRIASRLRSAVLAPILQRWRAARTQGPLPRFNAFDLGSDADRERCMVVGVDRRRLPMAFTVERIGQALNDAADGLAPGTNLPVVGNEALGSMEAAYRRCVRSRKPSYEYASFKFGEGAPALFERLLLPFSDDGEDVSKLVAVVVIDGLPTKPETGDPYECDEPDTAVRGPGAGVEC